MSEKSGPARSGPDSRAPALDEARHPPSPRSWPAQLLRPCPHARPALALVSPFPLVQAQNSPSYPLPNLLMRFSGLLPALLALAPLASAASEILCEFGRLGLRVLGVWGERLTIPSRGVADASAVSYCSNARAIEVQEFLLEYNHKASDRRASVAVGSSLADFEEGVGPARPTQSASRLAQPLSPPTSRPLWHYKSTHTASVRSTSPSTCAASSEESCARCKSPSSGRSAIGGRSSASASGANDRLNR